MAVEEFRPIKPNQTNWGEEANSMNFNFSLLKKMLTTGEGNNAEFLDGLTYDQFSRRYELDLNTTNEVTYYVIGEAYNTTNKALTAIVGTLSFMSGSATSPNLVGKYEILASAANNVNYGEVIAKGITGAPVVKVVTLIINTIKYVAIQLSAVPAAIQITFEGSYIKTGTLEDFKKLPAIGTTFSNVVDITKPPTDTSQVVIPNGVTTGTTDNYVVNFSDYPNLTLKNGTIISVTINRTNTTIDPTLQLNSLTLKPIRRSDGTKVAIGELFINTNYLFIYYNNTWLLMDSRQSILSEKLGNSIVIDNFTPSVLKPKILALGLKAGEIIPFISTNKATQIPGENPSIVSSTQTVSGFIYITFNDGTYIQFLIFSIQRLTYDPLNSINIRNYPSSGGTDTTPYWKRLVETTDSSGYALKAYRTIYEAVNEAYIFGGYIYFNGSYQVEVATITTNLTFRVRTSGGGIENMVPLAIGRTGIMFITNGGTSSVDIAIPNTGDYVTNKTLLTIPVDATKEISVTVTKLTGNGRINVRAQED